MIRVLTVFLTLAALTASGPGSLLHVHGYEAHEHPDHHHGPAMHAHEPAVHARHHQDAPARDEGTRVVPCDPGEHAVSAAFTGVSPSPHHAHQVAPAAGVPVAPPVPSARRLTPSDVRAHSPPRLTDAPLRAPPVVRPA